MPVTQRNTSGLIVLKTQPKYLDGVHTIALTSQQQQQQQQQPLYYIRFGSARNRTRSCTCASNLGTTYAHRDPTHTNYCMYILSLFCTLLCIYPFNSGLCLSQVNATDDTISVQRYRIHLDIIQWISFAKLSVAPTHLLNSTKIKRFRISARRALLLLLQLQFYTVLYIYSYTNINLLVNLWGSFDEAEASVYDEACNKLSGLLHSNIFFFFLSNNFPQFML